MRYEILRRIAFWVLHLVLSTITGFGAYLLARFMGIQNPAIISGAVSFSYGFLLFLLVNIAISIHNEV